MNAKWCISALIVILSLFGVNQHQTPAPNQEIVVQFGNIQISQDEAQSTIANVKLQLELLGVDNIQVQERSNGILKISYYSDSDVASIKKLLSKNAVVNLDIASDEQDGQPIEFPSDNNSNGYNLNVYEIQASSDTGLDLEGIAVIEIKSENHRFYNPNVFGLIDTIDDNERVVKIEFKVNTHVAIAIDNTSHKIPEVRAGPSC